MLSLPPALQPLDHYRQFIIYKAVPKKNQPGKTDKLPVNPYTKDVANAHDSTIWTDAENALAIAAAWGQPYGVGFVFTVNDPFWFVDIDNCLVNGQWSDVANWLMTQLAGSAVEVSQSGQGLHIIGSATYMPPHGCKNMPMGLELYHKERFVALTGINAIGDASTDHTATIPTIVDSYFPASSNEQTTDNKAPMNWTTAPVEGYSGPDDDQQLIEKMLSGRGDLMGQLFGNKASFADLWYGNIDVLSAAFPDHFANRPYDYSMADASLASRLAFWTGGNCERVERLMWQSALAREKWTKHKSYLKMTISKSVAGCSSFYTVNPDKDVPESVEPSETITTVNQQPEIVSGFQYLAAPQQIEHFDGCVYVQNMHKVFTPRGSLLDPGQFKATYGGYVFVLDAANDKTTKSAWEAFTESQVIRYPIAESLTFRPDRQAGELLEEEGKSVVNIYVPAKVERNKGDVSLFLDHLYRVLPDGKDAEILLAYMAACVQHIGVKFQWWPLLQGAEGNGKTLFTRCVAHAVGLHYSHFPRASEISNKFNSWMFGNVFIGVEDVYYPDHRSEIIENLKPIITNDVLPIEPKGKDQISARVCANGMLNSNHREAIRKTRNDRRFCVFYSAHQSIDDIERDNMTGSYFPDLYNWLKGEGKYKGQPSGYSIVSDYLYNYEIPDELNPATRCDRAPKTTTTDQVLIHSRGGVEQEILEAIDEDRPGFAGGWVSSMALDRLLEQLRMTRAISPNKRKELIYELGYIYHPALKNGRVNNPIAVDGGKPRLYIRKNHPDAAIESPAEAAKAYQQSQAMAGERLADRVFSK